MKKRKLKKALSTLMFAAGGIALASQAKANYSTFPYIETMENDTDSYVPPNNNPLGDPGLAGNAPGDFSDSRSASLNGGEGPFFRGVLEEVPNGFNGLTAPANPLYPGSHFAIAQVQGGAYVGYGEGFTGRPAQGGTAGGPTTPLENPGPMSAQMDLYLDDTFPAGGSPGQGAVWFESGVANNSTGYYLTEASLRGRYNGDGTWTFNTDSTHDIGPIPGNQWVTLEEKPVQSGTAMFYEFNIWSADHTALLGTFTKADYTGVATWANLGGPRFGPELDNIFPPAGSFSFFVDNAGWAAPVELVSVSTPEPASMALLAAGAGLMMLRRRRSQPEKS